MSSSWEQLSRSGLFVPAELESLQAQFRQVSRGRPEQQASDVVAWLRSSGIISEFQADLLRRGFAGSFSLGEYILVERRPSILGLATYSARHFPTRHDVQLLFVPGTTEDDVDLWTAVVARVDALQSCRQTGLLHAHETVELKDYRFVALDLPSGQPLEEKLGPRGRVPWQVACSTIASLADAIEEIHGVGLVHGNVNAREVFLEANGIARVSPPIWPTRRLNCGESIAGSDELAMARHYCRRANPQSAITAADDVFAISVLMYRLIRGETPDECLAGMDESPGDFAAAIGKLSKYKLPAELTGLLVSGLEIGGDRMKNFAEFSERLRAVPEWTNAAKPSSAPNSATTDAYSKWLDRWRVSPGEKRSAPKAVPQNESSTSAWLQTAVFSAMPTVDRSNNSPGRRRNKSARPNTVIWITSAAALFATLFAIFKWNQGANLNPPKERETARQVAEIETPTPTTNPASHSPGPSAETDGPKPTGNWIERIVDDNGEILWQSPTHGVTIDLKSVPAGATVFVIARPRELAKQAESSKVATAIGPEFPLFLNALFTQLLVPSDSIEQLVIAYYPTEQQVFEPLYRVRLVAPLSPGELTGKWQNSGFAAEADDPRIWSNGSLAFGARSLGKPVGESSDVEGAGTAVGEVVFGSRERVLAALDSNVANPLTGPLAQLIARTDQDRQLTILGLKAGLFSELGKSFLPTRYQKLQRLISTRIEDQVRAIALSIHWDEGVYAEIVFDETVDVKARDLRATVATQWKTAREELMSYIAGLPHDPYWEQVRQKYDEMLSDVSRHLRIDDEFNQVLLNIWLPPMAAHNLVAATELTLSAQPAEEAAVDHAAPSAPANIRELLQAHRTLQNDNPPDLNILIDSLRADVKDDFPNLPFEFEIRLSNVDLREGGITRNQRLTKLELVDQPLEQVLTQICFQANPDKNATGPADPKCTLVWVVTRDNEKNTELILITTRSAAAKNNWELPAAFTRNN